MARKSTKAGLEKRIVALKKAIANLQAQIAQLEAPAVSK